MHTIKKTILLGAIDFLLLLSCQIAVSWLHDISASYTLGYLGTPMVVVVTAYLVGLYDSSISHIGIAAVKQIGIAITVGFFGSIALADHTLAFSIFSSSLGLISLTAYRVLARELLFQRRHSTTARTLVYGAGSAGVQFVTASMQGDKHNVIAYVDDDGSLCGTSIHGRKVYPTNRVEQLIKNHEIQIIVLAIPSATKAERKQIIESLLGFPVRVVTVPTYDDLINGYQSITDTEEISIEDLLGRDPVPPIQEKMEARTKNKICLVTGAGGSIGSELCRQVSRCNPAQLILLDSSEPSLFSIEQELINSGFNDIVSVLGSVTDTHLVDNLFSEYTIQTVFHAAAYKHVPMVEANPLAGLVNNVHGTENILVAAIKHNCESFTLISTDKAVRPTNIMGATKRLAEMLCQAYADEQSGKTTISMVRFGNVLGSSGSVIPTFQRQIKAGGPVTLTHKDITRYFMTIPEAAQLVIQSAGMANGGDLFLLDMGSPVKIIDLAERLIKLSGKKIQNKEEAPTECAISIKITGLRPGEKLYEELLIESAAEQTEHPKIMRAQEPFENVAKIGSSIETLKSNLMHNNLRAFKSKLQNIVSGYSPS